MKLGIIADIHSNLEALRSVLDAMRDADSFICPGDIVGYGPNPNECIEILRGLDCRTVAGNHDIICAGKLDASNFSGDAREAIEWTSKVISQDNREFLKGLPERLEVDGLEVVHGSLRNPIEEYVMNIQAGAATIELMKKKVCFVGHLHIPLVVVKEKQGPSTGSSGSPQASSGGPKYDGWQLNDGDVVDVSKFERVIINAGAVGQPRDMDPRASFGVFDTDRSTVEIRKVKYNIASVQEKMRKADLPDFLIERLKYGR